MAIIKHLHGKHSKRISTSGERSLWRFQLKIIRTCKFRWKSPCVFMLFKLMNIWANTILGNGIGKSTFFYVWINMKFACLIRSLRGGLYYSLWRQGCVKSTRRNDKGGKVFCVMVHHIKMIIIVWKIKIWIDKFIYGKTWINFYI